jgi:type IV pilus assembly protein PilO
MNLFDKKHKSKTGSQSLGWRAQFAELNSKDPWLWPKTPRTLLFGLVALFTLALAWFLWLSNSYEELGAAQEQEVALKDTFTRKLGKVNNLAALKVQRQQVTLFVNQLEKQLPSKSEMDALLSDINQAGIGRGLHFELFKPGQVVVKDYYAELPIAVKVTGRYHELGSFTADVAALSRIVTLHNIGFAPVPGKDGILIMEATAKTYRYLDDEEIANQKKAKAAAKVAGQT